MFKIFFTHLQCYIAGSLQLAVEGTCRMRRSRTTTTTSKKCRADLILHQWGVWQIDIVGLVDASATPLASSIGSDNKAQLFRNLQTGLQCNFALRHPPVPLPWLCESHLLLDRSRLSSTPSTISYGSRCPLMVHKLMSMGLCSFVSAPFRVATAIAGTSAPNWSCQR